MLLGGSHRPLAAAVGDAMRDVGLRAIDELGAIPEGLRGLHPANPVNLPQEGGVQIEMAASVRRPPFSGRIVETVSRVVVGLDEPSK